MADNVARDPALAIGSDSRESWLQIGELQFDYLKSHGLQPHHRILDIGCGNLRAGWRLIDYLDVGNYYGIDISPDVLIAAQDVVSEFELQEKMPYLVYMTNLRFGWLPDQAFDVIHAHSVFTHTPLDVLDECLANVRRIMKPEGFFDFTFDEGERNASFLKEDFYYQPDEMLTMVAHRGLVGRIMKDWIYSQAKVRVTVH